MNRTLSTVAACAGLLAALATAPAQAQVAASISIGEPNFFGRIDLGGMPPPQVLYAQPVVVAPQAVVVDQPPIYLRVPPDQARHWRRYCGRYGACGQRVLFVRDDWYSRVYAPAWREHHDGPWRRDQHGGPPPHWDHGRGDGDRYHDDRGDHGDHGDRHDDHGRDGGGRGPYRDRDRDRDHDHGPDRR